MQTPGLEAQGKRELYPERDPADQRVSRTGSRYPGVSLLPPPSLLLVPPRWKLEGRGDWVLSPGTRTGTARLTVTLGGQAVCMWGPMAFGFRDPWLMVRASPSALLTPAAPSSGRSHCRAYPASVLGSESLKTTCISPGSTKKQNKQVVGLKRLTARNWLLPQGTD